MKSLFGVVADAANVSTEGKVNLLGAFSTIHVPALPAIHPSLALVVMLQPDQEDIGQSFRIMIRWVDPDKRLIQELPTHTIVLPTPAPIPLPNIPFIGIIQLLTIHTLGPHTLEFYCEGGLLDTVPIEVRPHPSLSQNAA